MQCFKYSAKVQVFWFSDAAMYNLQRLKSYFDTK